MNSFLYRPWIVCTSVSIMDFFYINHGFFFWIDHEIFSGSTTEFCSGLHEFVSDRPTNFSWIDQGIFPISTMDFFLYVCIDHGFFLYQPWIFFLDRLWFHFWIDHAILSESTTEFCSGLHEFVSDRPTNFFWIDQRIFPRSTMYFFLDRPRNFPLIKKYIIPGSTMDFFLDQTLNFFWIDNGFFSPYV